MEVGNRKWKHVKEHFLGNAHSGNHQGKGVHERGKMSEVEIQPRECKENMKTLRTPRELPIKVAKAKKVVKDLKNKLNENFMKKGGKYSKHQYIALG